LSLYRSKTFWVATAIFSPLLLVASYYGFKIMTSVYKQDFGNGLVIYADDYVNSGKWVYNCNSSRLISREPLIFPASALEDAGKLTIDDNMLSLNGSDKADAKIVIRAATKIEGWYKKLHYIYSVLDESSNLNTHVFDMFAEHNDRQWELKVRQWIDSRNRSTFEISAKLYDPETYMDHAKLLQAAAKSCPAPQ